MAIEILALRKLSKTAEVELTDLEKREAEHTRRVLLFAAEKVLLEKVATAAEAYLDNGKLRSPTHGSSDNWVTRKALRDALATWRKARSTDEKTVAEGEKKP